jgi:hypothetical protein
LAAKMLTVLGASAALPDVPAYAQTADEPAPVGRVTIPLPAIDATGVLRSRYIADERPVLVPDQFFSKAPSGTSTLAGITIRDDPREFLNVIPAIRRIPNGDVIARCTSPTVNPKRAVLRPVYLDVDVKSLCDVLGENRSNVWHCAKLSMPSRLGA